MSDFPDGLQKWTGAGLMFRIRLTGVGILDVLSYDPHTHVSGLQVSTFLPFPLRSSLSHSLGELSLCLSHSARFSLPHCPSRSAELEADPSSTTT